MSGDVLLSDGDACALPALHDLLSLCPLGVHPNAQMTLHAHCLLCDSLIFGCVSPAPLPLLPPSAHPGGLTPLHLASCRGDLDMVRHLLECGASPLVRDARGLTALHHAATQPRPDIFFAVLAAAVNWFAKVAAATANPKNAGTAPIASAAGATGFMRPFPWGCIAGPPRLSEPLVPAMCRSEESEYSALSTSASQQGAGARGLFSPTLSHSGRALPTVAPSSSTFSSAEAPTPMRPTMTRPDVVSATMMTYPLPAAGGWTLVHLLAFAGAHETLRAVLQGSGLGPRETRLASELGLSITLASWPAVAASEAAAAEKRAEAAKAAAAAASGTTTEAAAAAAATEAEAEAAAASVAAAAAATTSGRTLGSSCGGGSASAGGGVGADVLTWAHRLLGVRDALRNEIPMHTAARWGHPVALFVLAVAGWMPCAGLLGAASAAAAAAAAVFAAAKNAAGSSTQQLLPAGVTQQAVDASNAGTTSNEIGGGSGSISDGSLATKPPHRPRAASVSSAVGGGGMMLEALPALLWVFARADGAGRTCAQAAEGTGGPLAKILTRCPCGGPLAVIK